MGAATNVNIEDIQALLNQPNAAAGLQSVGQTAGLDIGSILGGVSQAPTTENLLAASKALTQPQPQAQQTTGQQVLSFLPQVASALGQVAQAGAAPPAVTSSGFTGLGLSPEQTTGIIEQGNTRVLAQQQLAQQERESQRQTDTQKQQLQIQRSAEDRQEAESLISRAKDLDTLRIQRTQEPLIHAQNVANLADMLDSPSTRSVALANLNQQDTTMRLNTLMEIIASNDRKGISREGFANRTRIAEMEIKAAEALMKVQLNPPLSDIKAVDALRAAVAANATLKEPDPNNLGKTIDVRDPELALAITANFLSIYENINIEDFPLLVAEIAAINRAVNTQADSPVGAPTAKGVDLNTLVDVNFRAAQTPTPAITSLNPLGPRLSPNTQNILDVISEVR